jgi:hypothetical protein
MVVNKNIETSRQPVPIKGELPRTVNLGTTFHASNIVQMNSDGIIHLFYELASHYYKVWISRSFVRPRRIELRTSSMSTKRSTTELRARYTVYLVGNSWNQLTEDLHKRLVFGKNFENYHTEVTKVC